jgi:hypothetical protein
MTSAGLSTRAVKRLTVNDHRDERQKSEYRDQRGKHRRLRLWNVRCGICHFQRLDIPAMLQRRDQQRQQPDGNHQQSKLVRTDQFFALRNSRSRDPKELLDRKAERDEGGRGSDPRQHGPFIGEEIAINCQEGRTIRFLSLVGHSGLFGSG